MTAEDVGDITVYRSNGKITEERKMINGKKVLFSGMQATGNLTLGNYLGALKN